MKPLNVLIACEESAVVREEFTKRGHNAFSCDLLPSRIPGKHFQCDVLEILDYGWDLMIAHPECRFLTVSGNRWLKPEYAARFPNRAKQRDEAAAFFMKLVNANIPMIGTENPIGIMSTRYRKPDQIIQPWMFGHAETKATCLWLKGLPLLKPTCIVEPVVIHHKSGRTDSPTHFRTLGLPSEERRRERSVTYSGIAAAMAAQWGC